MLLYWSVVVASALSPWSKLGVASPVCDRIEAMGLSQPTAIQEAAIPVIGKGHDVVIHAETGSGKTVAYLAPLSGPTLIVAPSKLLCVQIARCWEAVHGTRPGKSVWHALEGGGAAIVTPKDAWRQLQQPREALSGVCLVLDEADALLEPRSKYEPRKHRAVGDKVARMVLERAPDAQVVAASATVGRPLRRALDGVLDVAGRRQKSMIEVVREARSSSEKGQRAVTAPKCITHAVLEHDEAPIDAIVGALKALKKHTVLVTVANEGHPQDLVDVLREANVPATLIDDAAPDDRIVVAPTRSLRGIDLPDLDVVLLVGRPGDCNDYLHVAGRAGRAGRPGLALTLATENDVAVLRTWVAPLDVQFRRTTWDRLGNTIHNALAHQPKRGAKQYFHH